MWNSIVFNIYFLISPFLFYFLLSTSKFGEFISPAEVALVCFKHILSFIKFCSLVTELWLICGF